MSRSAVDKKIEVENKLHGCNSVQNIIPTFAMEAAAGIFEPCSISLVLNTDDYISPQMGCLLDFMHRVSAGLLEIKIFMIPHSA